MIKLIDILKEYNITRPSFFPTRNDMIELINNAQSVRDGYTYLYVNVSNKVSDTADKLGRETYKDEWEELYNDDREEAHEIYHLVLGQFAKQIKEYLFSKGIESEILGTSNNSIISIKNNDFRKLKEKFKK